MALAWLGAWVTGLVHVAVETHVYCGEHRQFEEHADDADQGVDPHDHGAEVRAGERSASRGHEGCSVLEAKPGHDRDATPSIATRTATPGAPAIAVPLPPVRTIPLFRLAPKASPPRAA